MGVVLAVGGATALASVVSWSPGGIITYGPDSGPALVDAPVGECLDARPDERGSYAAVPCDGPHDVEVSAIVAVPASADSRHPGHEPLDFLGAAACRLAFTAYVGQDYWRSELDYRALLPGPEMWESGSRDIVCLIRSLDAEALMGSVRDSRR